MHWYLNPLKEIELNNVELLPLKIHITTPYMIHFFLLSFQSKHTMDELFIVQSFGVHEDQSMMKNE